MGGVCSCNDIILIKYNDNFIDDIIEKIYLRSFDLEILVNAMNKFKEESYTSLRKNFQNLLETRGSLRINHYNIKVRFIHELLDGINLEENLLDKSFLNCICHEQ